MANTFTQLYVQIIFAVNGRKNLISKQFREELHKYITGIVQKRDHKMLAIYCMPDHLHFLAGINPAKSISDLVRDVKADSSNFINRNRWIKGKFNWQTVYGGFSYSRSQIDTVIKYIMNQEELHKITTFKDEYIDFLKNFEIEYDEKYLFEWLE